MRLNGGTTYGETRWIMDAKIKWKTIIRFSNTWKLYFWSRFPQDFHRDCTRQLVFDEMTRPFLVNDEISFPILSDPLPSSLNLNIAHDLSSNTSCHDTMHEMSGGKIVQICVEGEKHCNQHKDIACHNNFICKRRNISWNIWIFRYLIINIVHFR